MEKHNFPIMVGEILYSICQITFQDCDFKRYVSFIKLPFSFLSLKLRDLGIHIKSFLSLVWFIDNFCQNVSYQSQKSDTKGGSISMDKLQVWKIFLWSLNIKQKVGWKKKSFYCNEKFLCPLVVWPNSREYREHPSI